VRRSGAFSRQERSRHESYRCRTTLQPSLERRDANAIVQLFAEGGTYGNPHAGQGLTGEAIVNWAKSGLGGRSRRRRAGARLAVWRYVTEHSGGGPSDTGRRRLSMPVTRRNGGRHGTIQRSRGALGRCSGMAFGCARVVGRVDPGGGRLLWRRWRLVTRVLGLPHKRA
jgi:hypothetical protein